jgi:ABC-2 type transport system ATP-binding protein
MSPLITVKSLSRRFGDFIAVDNISMEVKKGDILGFIGPNGAGKTTTMRIITGYIAPSKGEVKVCDYDVVENAVEVKRKIGYMPEGVPAYKEMTSYEMLEFIADVRGIPRKERKKAIEDASEKSSLEEKLHQPISTLSKGYRRRLGFAGAIIHNPDVLILDEPTEGLDPNQKFEFHNLIKRISAEKAIIISTHILEEVEKLCNKIIVINKGKIVANTTTQGLREQAYEHNAVELFFKGKTKEDIKSIAVHVGSIAEVSSINIEDGEDGILLTAYAKKGVAIKDKVIKLVSEKGLAADKVVELTGKMDSAFRFVTKN